MVDRGNFLEPETRCGVFISSDTKKAWKRMLDMLEVYIAICKKHRFTYYVMGGTMLGAARHEGMIPWDDDVDVMMPRDDYEKLVAVLPAELPPTMFAQTTITDTEYLNSHLKIRYNGTSGIDPSVVRRGVRYHFGIFIDVFPIDGVPNNPHICARRNRLLKIFQAFESNTYNRVFPSLWKRMKHWIFWSLFHIIGRRRYCKLREGFLSSYTLSESKEWVAAVGNFGYNSRYRWPSEYFERGAVELPFEYLTVAVPKRYEEILEKTYGDWHEFVKGASYHGGLILDADIPYNLKLSQLEGAK